MREICFRVLIREQGGARRTALAHHGRFGKIAKALRRIHADYTKPFDVTRPAGEAGMSVPAFHAHRRKREINPTPPGSANNFRRPSTASPVVYS
jgi:hypothetical protein